MHWLFANDEVLRADLPGVCLIGIWSVFDWYLSNSS